MVSSPLIVLVAPLYLVSSADLFRVSESETQSSDISWWTLSWKDFYSDDLFQCIFTEKQTKNFKNHEQKPCERKMRKLDQRLQAKSVFVYCTSL